MRTLHTSILTLFFFVFASLSLSAQADISCTQTVENSTGTNNLENYPIRPVGLFSGPEVIIPIDILPGALQVCITTSNRVRLLPPNPGDFFGDVDLFVLTDPTDASSAILWVNGLGNTSCFNPVAGQDYYLVIDGFRGSIAILDIAISGASCPPPSLDIQDPCTCTDPLNIKNNQQLTTHFHDVLTINTGIPGRV